ncbi:MAG: hypothetical protein QXE06_07815 [Candidatus Bathyarchaeia archaeon]
MVQRLRQDEHDNVVEYLATIYRNQYPKVYTNPDGQKNTNIKGHEDVYPDILVADEQNILIFIEEVETEDTVTEEHAKEQWIPYSKVRTTFYLRVPFGSQNTARNILAKLGINAIVKCYSIAQNQVTLKEC